MNKWTWLRKNGLRKQNDSLQRRISGFLISHLTRILAVLTALMRKIGLRKLDNSLQKRISGSFIDYLPRILAAVTALMVLLGALRIYIGGQRFLGIASRQELVKLTQTADPSRPSEAHKDGIQRPADILGNTMGYELTSSKHYSFGHMVTTDGAVVYALDGNTPEKDSPFYNLVKADETDGNLLRMLPECYGETLVRTFNPITGIHAGKRSNVTLTLSGNVQSAVYDYMGKHGMDGTCVAFHPQTGEVICLVSNNAPRNLYRINENLGTARPASVFKVLLCALLEEQGVVDTAALHYDCDGKYTLRDGSIVRCAEKKAHGSKLSTEDALGVSCNCFFAQAIEEHLDWEQAQALLRQMGVVVNGEGEGEHHLGRLERDASRMTLSEGEDAFSDVWSLLGEGKNSASPVDMVQWCAAIVNGGGAAKLRLTEGEQPEERRFFSAEAAERVYEQWKAAYARYYSDRGYDKRITVAKTGTDQVDSKGNEAYTLMGYSEELDTAFFIRINNAVTKNGQKTLKKRPADLARVLLKAVQA